MASKNEPKRQKPRRPPATTPEAREKQMIALAMDVAEQQLLDGTAPAQVVSHFLKLATSREKLEQQNLEKEIELRSAKVHSISQAANSEALYQKALNAMRSYSGLEVEDEYED